MIRAFLWRPSLLMLFVALVLVSFGASMAPSVRAQAATAASPVKVVAKEVNSKYSFGPVKTKVKLGGAIVWKNTTDVAHTVTSTTKGWTYDKKLKTGASLRYTFMKAGTFHYKCSFHPGMAGTVIVTK
jgi:plastocyanin